MLIEEAAKLQPKDVARMQVRQLINEEFSKSKGKGKGKQMKVETNFKGYRIDLWDLADPEKASQNISTNNNNKGK